MLRVLSDRLLALEGAPWRRLSARAWAGARLAWNSPRGAAGICLAGHALWLAAFGVFLSIGSIASRTGAWQALALITSAAGQVVGVLGLMRCLYLTARRAIGGQAARWPSVWGSLVLSFSLPGIALGLPALAASLLYAWTSSPTLGRALERFYDWFQPGGGVPWMWFGLLQSAGLLVTVIAFVVRPGLMRVERSRRDVSAQLTILGFGAGIALWALGSGAQWLMAASQLPFLSEGWTPAAPATPRELGLGLLIAGLIAPAAEELFFRGFALRAWESRFGPARAIVATAALFAVAHLNPAAFPGLLLIGLGLGWLTLKAGRLWPAVVAHSTINVISLCLLYVLSRPS